jgi:hypothetical protein
MPRPPDTQDFHRVLSGLLQLLGWRDLPAAPGQDLFSLRTEGGYDIHFGLIDHEHWFMLADLGVRDNGDDALTEALRCNQIAAARWQPVVALDAELRLCCWLCLPLSGCDRPALADAFDALIATAERLLGSPPSRAPVFRPGPSR